MEEKAAEHRTNRRNSNSRSINNARQRRHKEQHGYRRVGLTALPLCNHCLTERTRIAVRVPQPSVSRIAISAEPDNCPAARTEFSAKQFFADRPPSSTELLLRAAETDPEAASLLSAHPRNVDGAILLVHLLG